MWAKIPDEFYDDPTLDRVGPAAVGVYVRMLAYCARHLTDGHVPARGARFLAWDDETLIEPLIREGLVERREDGYHLPRFLDHNPSKAKAERDRDEARKRAAKSRRKRRTAPAPENASNGGDPFAVIGDEA